MHQTEQTSDASGLGRHASCDGRHLFLIANLSSTNPAPIHPVRAHPFPAYLKIVAIYIIII